MLRPTARRAVMIGAAATAALAPRAHAQTTARPATTAAPAPRFPAPATTIPTLDAIGGATSELRDLVDRWRTDWQALQRRYDVPGSPERTPRLRAFLDGWRTRLADVPFDRLSQEGRIDYVLLRTELTFQLALLDRDTGERATAAALVPFAPRVLALHDARRRMEPVRADSAARALAALAAEIDTLRRRVPADDAPARPAAAVGRESQATSAAAPRPSRIAAARAAAQLDELRETLGEWYRFSAGYDPMFTWWVAEPYRKADDALKAYARTVRERLVGIRDGQDPPVVGSPIGSAGLAADLAHEMIPYTPEELVAIAEREFAWCEAEIRRAARDMGYGDDWRAALEKVKGTYVPPGQQTALARDLADEAVRFVEARDLVTVPPLAKEIWRMTMLSPEQQKVAPFFLGGEVLQVAFPTDAMTTEDKMMSLRGNNPHFARATVFHELIPGHHLQGFYAQRWNAHRRPFATPFYTEGWSLWWEMLLWDQGFPRSPEDRIGMLFWRMHRCARIIFSLRFHLGTMTPEQAVDFLVQRVGHERANAAAEVRRSFNGTYPPLYQIAYMIGALQLRALHHELVDSRKMTDRQFHDAVLQGGNMPITMVRARLVNAPLARDGTPRWRFADDDARR